MKSLTLIIFLVLILCGSGRVDPLNFDDFRNSFVKGYRSLHIPPLYLSYAENLQNIPAEEEINKQADFFHQVKRSLPAYGKHELTDQQRDDLDLINYEADLNLQRLALEKEWKKIRPAVIPTNNFHAIPDDSAWYVYFLQRWIGAKVNPDELYLNGLLEIDSVKQHIEDIRYGTGMDSVAFYRYLNDSSFFYTSETGVRQAFEHTKATVLKNLPKLFSITAVPDVGIERGTNHALARTPGYYADNTFYYNYEDSPYNKRQVDWLFLHEAVPGHHYQTSVAAQSASTALEQMFWYPGFSEGWAAYAEQLGKELGVYQTPYDELGKWEWDLVRSVRVPLDIGLNFYGWDDQKALAFWKKYIPGQDAIALREITRMRSWPAQVITYKYGAAEIMRWKNLLQLEEGDHFDIRDFHTKLLQYGPLPFFLLERKIFRQ